MLGAGGAALERFQAKWKPVRVKNTRQIEELVLHFDSTETEHEVLPGRRQPSRGCLRVSGSNLASLQPSHRRIQGATDRVLDLAAQETNVAQLAVIAFQQRLDRGAALTMSSQGQHAEAEPRINPPDRRDIAGSVAVDEIMLIVVTPNGCRAAQQAPRRRRRSRRLRIT